MVPSLCESVAHLLQIIWGPLMREYADFGFNIRYILEIHSINDSQGVDSALRSILDHVAKVLTACRTALEEVRAIEATWQAKAASLAANYQPPIPPFQQSSMFNHLKELFYHTFSSPDHNVDLRDGNQILSGSEDLTIRVWDAKTARQLLSLEGHSDAVFSVSFSWDGKLVTSGSDDETIRIWDARPIQKSSSRRAHMGVVNDVTFSKDGESIVSASDDRSACVWSARTGWRMLTLEGHTSQVSCAIFSSDGKKIMTVEVDLTARIWDASTGLQMLTLAGPGELISSMSLWIGQFWWRAHMMGKCTCGMDNLVSKSGCRRVTNMEGGSSRYHLLITEHWWCLVQTKKQHVSGQQAKVRTH